MDDLLKDLQYRNELLSDGSIYQRYLHMPLINIFPKYAANCFF